MIIKSISYHSSVIDRLKNPAYAAAYLNAILEEVDPEPDLLKSALLNIAEALGDRLESSALIAHQDRLTVLLSNSNPLSIVDLMTWLEPFGLRLLVMTNPASDDATPETYSSMSEAS
jgi:DNA-binding phage protein